MQQCQASPAATSTPDPSLAAPERWLESRRRSRARRLAEARAAARRRLSRRGVASLVAVMALGAGGAAAHETAGGHTAGKPKARTTVQLLKIGSSGPAVVALQRALGITADGAFGPATRRAVRRFQRSHGLTADGIAGPATLGALGLATTARTRAARPSAPSGLLARIAQCESGGDPTAVSANGRYRGKYQFSRATWRALGGKGDPAKAPEAEQDRRAAALLAAEGTSPWPVCGRRARS